MKLIIMLFSIIFITTAKAESKQELFRKNINNTIVEILCTTNVIKDMDSVARNYYPLLNNAGSEAERKKINLEFSINLQNAWSNQRFDLSNKKELVNFLKFINTIPLKDQSEFSKEWTSAAQRQCPAAAYDYNATFSAALTLISTISN